MDETQAIHFGFNPVSTDINGSWDLFKRCYEKYVYWLRKDLSSFEVTIITINFSL